jgi:predicted RNase H-like HicB family nuclease
MAKGKATKKEIEEIVSRPYTIEVVYGETPDEGVLARVAEWTGCMTAGDTREEALARIGDAMRDWVRARMEEGRRIPEPMTKYGGKVVVQMPRSLHRDVMHRAENEGVSMNQWISTTLARAVGSEGKSERSTALRTRARKQIVRRRTARGAGHAAG